MTSLSAKEIEDQFFGMVADGNYERALSLVTEHFALFPPHAQSVVYLWRMDMACRLGNDSLALDLLKQAVNAGHWYASLDKNPNFRILNDSTAFQHLITLCAQRRAEEIARSRAELKILEPEQQGDAYPTVFALHGNSGNIESFAPHWQYAVHAGWLVVLPQSPQALGPEMYVWNDWDWVVPSLVAQYRDVCTTYPVDPTGTVLAGFSMGAGLALRQAFERTIPVNGVLAVAPFLSDAEKLRPALTDPQNREMSVYLVASQEDEYCYAVAQKLSLLFQEYGIRHYLDIYTDVGHAFPASFEPRIPSALDFIRGRS